MDPRTRVSKRVPGFGYSFGYPVPVPSTTKDCTNAILCMVLLSDDIIDYMTKVVRIRRVANNEQQNVSSLVRPCDVELEFVKTVKAQFMKTL
jgi:hypothetical protein